MANRVAIGLIWCKGRILVGTRAPDAVLAGHDEFPGGKCLDGEEPSETVVRECLEETGLRVRVLGLRRSVDHQYSHGSLRMWFFDAEPVDESPDEPSAPFRWVPVADLDRLHFPPANDAVLRSIRERPVPDAGPTVEPI